MSFLVDAQLPPLLAVWLLEKGFDAIHTNDLPDGDETADSVIRAVAEVSGRIVITKDSDFYDSHLLFGRPAKLLLITTGNLKNRQLLDLFRQNFGEIVPLFQLYNLIELNNNEIIVHR
jgi:predicted nuclease of predicted toxin-antitoxin system